MSSNWMSSTRKKRKPKNGKVILVFSANQGRAVRIYIPNEDRYEADDFHCSECGSLLWDWAYHCKSCGMPFCSGCLDIDGICGLCSDEDDYEGYYEAENEDDI